MLCNVCGKNESTIHLTEIVNSQMVELHLCENCAHEKGGNLTGHFTFNEVLSGLGDLSALLGGQKTEELKCQGCGLTYEEFGRVGRLGCSDCYHYFAKPLAVLIKRVQKGAQHIGKRPEKASSEVVRNHTDLRDLHERLKNSIQSEEFEEAARIRDQIKKLEIKIKKGNSKNNH